MSSLLQRRRELFAVNGPVLKAARTALRVLPSATKWLVLLLFLINAKSWPLMWHIRVFRPVFRIRAEYHLLLWRTMFCSKTAQDKRIDQWLDARSPIGEDPFDKISIYKTRATIDDSDFNGHLSNSSYAKTLDSARFYMAIEMFTMFFRSGGWMALGGTHFIYLKEIPMMVEYEVRSSLVSWDQKWMFVLHRFVTKPKGKRSNHQSTPYNQSPSPDPAVQNVLHASLRTQTDTTPALSTSPLGEPDGATLHTISISEVCFKIGRITVPPALAIAANGFSAPPSEFGSSLNEYSKTNPPPHWGKAKEVMSVPSGGSTKKLRNLFVGGWRDMSESERWWDQALSGVVEQRRKARLEVVASLRSGMEGAKALISIYLNHRFLDPLKSISVGLAFTPSTR
ncbi:hypothetical protein NP233_g3829 [Leucocoprinus birnbaumii]|uniref:Uncharacterized protein n=1 Tax=Leucocoprinus birnbaumii TaxID=56174 RepID=A0AAD5VYH8_9AGAR|nr:hypothetical protein NP233_g3829 [Leucocoprinus birnbaumii]